MATCPTVTFYGRVSFPSFTAKQAFDLSQSGQFPVDSVDKASPNVTFLVTEVQFDKVKKYLLEQFLPYCAAQFAAGGAKERDALSPDDIAKLTAAIEGDPADAEYNIPFKVLSDKSAELAPEAAGVVKVMGRKGLDLVLKAAARSEKDLADPTSDILKFPVILPIEDTVFELYPGCVGGTTAKAYAYHNGKRPGVSLSCDTVIHRGDATRFGGGPGVDEDEFFADE